MACDAMRYVECRMFRIHHCSPDVSLSGKRFNVVRRQLHEDTLDLEITHEDVGF